MARYNGGESVRAGFYWNPSQWDVVSIPKEGGTLPAAERYIRLPLLALMVLGPFMGALYVIFLPLIGFAMLFAFGATKLLAVTRAAVGAPLGEPEEVLHKDE